MNSKVRPSSLPPLDKYTHRIRIYINSAACIGTLLDNYHALRSCLLIFHARCCSRGIHGVLPTPREGFGEKLPKAPMNLIKRLGSQQFNLKRHSLTFDQNTCEPCTDVLSIHTLAPLSFQSCRNLSTDVARIITEYM